MNFTYVEVLAFKANTTLLASQPVEMSYIITHIISNFTNHLFVCNDFARNLYFWQESRINEFGTAQNYMTGFL